jgi:CRP-like cAMP-binding protein/SAM-dependent methyltransferase
MQEALSLLSDLLDTDVDWVLANGVEQQVIASTTLTREGETPDALYIVLEGLVGVRLDKLGVEPIRTLGPGEIIGEMSFVENVPAAATATAVENTLVLALPRPTLDAKAKQDPAFASRLFRAFARCLSRRLRAANAALGQLTGSGAHLGAATRDRWSAIDAHIEEFKRALAAADRAALKHDGVVPPEVETDIRSRFAAFVGWMNEQIGDRSPDPPEVRQELGAKVQHEVLPYLMLTKNGERWYSKPRGYAGDFMSIEWIYEASADGTGRLGPLLDRCFLEMDAAQAVFNRRQLLVEEITKTMAERDEPARVLSMACGPARELFDVYAKLADPGRLVAACLDIDLQALAFVGDVRDRRKLKSRMRLENGNLVYLATGRHKLDLPPQDLAYSIGLIDYFNDAFVVKLLDFVHDKLRPGGRVILGNFHPRNPTKAMMDYVLDWKLIHRDEDDMNRIFAASRFGRPCDEIRFEPRQVNLFAIAAKR